MNINVSDSEKDELTKKMKEINEAYDVLGDVNKKNIYDSNLKNKDSQLNNGNRSGFSGSKYKDNGWNFNDQYVSLSMQEIVTFPFEKLLNFQYSYNIIFRNHDNNKQGSEIVNVKFDISNLPGDIQLVVDSYGERYMKIVCTYNGRCNIFNNVRGNFLLILMFKLPNTITIDNDMNITQEYTVTLYDALFNENIEVETIFKQKYKLKIKNLKSVSKIKCILPDKGLTYTSRVLFKDVMKTSNYIFELNIKELNMDNLDWKDKSKFKKMVEIISNPPDNK
jgi:DnaJ-class molecular chaperone